jgi:hypothetical protein
VPTHRPRAAPRASAAPAPQTGGAVVASSETDQDEPLEQDGDDDTGKYGLIGLSGLLGLFGYKKYKDSRAGTATRTDGTDGTSRRV